MTVRDFTMLAIGSLLGLCLLLAASQRATALRLSKVEAELKEMKTAAALQGYMFVKPSEWHPAQR